MPPLVSILIPTYNREGLISRAIESALNQTYANIEIIIVDNASTDSSWEIINVYREQSPLIRCYRNKKNVGPIRNWINCLKFSQGAFIKILFSDDWLSNDAVEKLITPMLADDEIGFSYSAVEIHFSQLGKTKSVTTNYKLQNATKKQSGDFLVNFILGDGRIPVSPGCALFRRADVEYALTLNWNDDLELGCFEKGIGSDLLIFLSASASYPFYYHIPETLAYFSGHEKSITLSNKMQTVIGCHKEAIWFHLCKSIIDARFKKKMKTLMFLISILPVKNSSDFIQRQKYKDNFIWLDIFLITPFLFRFAQIKFYSVYLKFMAYVRF